MDEASVIVQNPPTVPLLPLACYRLTFRAADNLRLPAYTGSAWRGAFGYHFGPWPLLSRSP